MANCPTDVRPAAAPIEFPVEPADAAACADSLVSRIAPAPQADKVNPDHHLWRNGRLWWIAFTVHRGYLQERVRFSLGTDDVAEARRKRDRILATYASAAACELSLRFTPRGRTRGARRARDRRTRLGAAREMQQ